MFKLPDFIAKVFIKFSLDDVEKKRRIVISEFDIFSKNIVVNEVMNRLERDHNKGKINRERIVLFSILLASNKRSKKEKDINRIARILSWKEFRKYHYNGNDITREILKAVENRVLGSKADELVEKFKNYCRRKGKEFPDVTKPTIDDSTWCFMS